MSSKPAILVVGGAGYIGSHTTLALAEAGYEVVIYDNFSRGHREACFDFDVVEGELADEDRLAAVLGDRDISCIVHFAALIEAGQSVVDPLAFYRNNVAATLALLGAMKAAGATRIVFSSTAAVYGNADEESLGEDLPMAPINPYGHSKAMVETILASVARADGVRALALRYFNAAGADPLCRSGERHDPETHLIPLTIQAARGLRPEIRIFGTNYPTPDGTCIRDYVHVVDLAAGHVAAVEALLRQEAPGFASVNLGTGSGYSVREVIDMVRSVSGREFPVIAEAARPGDPARLIADPSRAKALLGWQTHRSDLKTIVEDAWRFHEASYMT